MSVLNAEPRSEGLKPKQLRRLGILPMALVKKDHTTVPLQTKVEELKRATAHIDGLGRLDLQIEGEKKLLKVILKQIDKDYIRQQLIHITVQEVSEDDRLKMDVVVHSVGTPQPVIDNLGTIVQVTDALTLRAKLSEMPESIEVDVAHLELNTAIMAHEITLPEGVELLSSPDATLFSVQHVKVVSLEPETEAAEPAEIGAEEETEGTEETEA
jgi:large subunit ribosomal protein L25